MNNVIVVVIIILNILFKYVLRIINNISIILVINTISGTFSTVLLTKIFKWEVELCTVYVILECCEGKTNMLSLMLLFHAK